MEDTGRRETERNYGIDLLRIAAMLMIPVLHVLGQGGVLGRTAQNAANYYACWLLETACLCAVNCYALISGYAGSRARWKPEKLLYLSGRVLFYSLSITAVLGTVHPDWIERDILLKTFLPFQWKTWWYYSAYAGLFFLMPVLNRGLQGLSVREKKRLLPLLFLVFSVLTCFSKPFGIDPLELTGGYSVIWLLVLYLVGACLRESAWPRLPKAIWLSGFFLNVLLAWGWKYLTDTGVLPSPADTQYARLFLTYTAPPIFLCGVCLLLFFAGLKIRSAWMRRLIRGVAPLTFSIYIIHTHPLIWEHILKEAFVKWRTMQPQESLPRVLLAALLIFTACALIEYIRSMLARFLGGLMTKRPS